MLEVQGGQYRMAGMGNNNLPSPGLLAASRVRKPLGHMGWPSANEMGNDFCALGSTAKPSHHVPSHHASAGPPADSMGLSSMGPRRNPTLPHGAQGTMPLDRRCRELERMHPKLLAASRPVIKSDIA